MQRSARRLVVTIAIVGGLLATAAAAHASEAVISPAGSISAPSTGKVSLSGGIFSLRCFMTLNGSLLSGPIRTEGTEQIGSISEVTVSSCEGGNVAGALFPEGPWPIRLVRTLGTAPNAVTGILSEIIGFNLRLGVFGEAVNCLWAGDLGMLMALSTTRRAGIYTSGSITLLASRLSLHEGGGLCPSIAAMRGSFSITPQTITVT